MLYFRILGCSQSYYQIVDKIINFWKKKNQNRKNKLNKNTTTNLRNVKSYKKKSQYCGTMLGQVDQNGITRSIKP